TSLSQSSRDDSAGQGARPGDVLGGSGGDDPAPLGTGAGAEVDDPVGADHHLGAVLDDDHRMTPIHQGVQGIEQSEHVEGVQTGSGLVEDEDRLRDVASAVERGGRATQEACQLEPLGLAAGERRRGLAQPKIVESYVQQRMDPSLDLAAVAEENERLARREIEDFRDVSPPVGDLEDLRAIARTTALGAAHVHIGQKLHVDREEAVSLAGATPPALDVEAEEARAIVSQLGLVSRGEGPPDLVEGLQVSDRVGSTRPADRGLIEEDRVLELAGSLEIVEVGDGQRLLMQPLAERGVERLLDQGALASTADAGDDAQNPQRESHVDRLQIVAPGAPESQKPLGRCTPGRWNLHALAAREEIAGERSLDLGERADRSGVEQMTPSLARTG